MYLVTIRDETEWIESVKCGANKLTKINEEEIINNIESHYNFECIHPYGMGTAAEKIYEAING